MHGVYISCNIHALVYMLILIRKNVACVWILWSIPGHEIRIIGLVVRQTTRPTFQVVRISGHIEGGLSHDFTSSTAPALLF